MPHCFIPIQQTKSVQTITAVANQIGSYYGSTATKAAIGVASISTLINQGWIHFQAFRVNTPPGGILLGQNITFAIASDNLKNNHDVWSISKPAAERLAANISFGSSPVRDNPHNRSNGFVLRGN